jgi:LmbE family N-acetylglucosaminyl deacetylase
MAASADRILVVAAHPDDEVLGCGGMIARHTDAGDAVRVMFLAEGITARYEPEQFRDPDVQAQMQRRNGNARKALGILGVRGEEVFPSERYCCRLDQVPEIDLVKGVEQHIDEWRPSRIYTHAAHDTNIDHRRCHTAVIAACRPVRKARVRQLLAMEVLSSTEWNPSAPFPASVFCDVSAQIDRKIAALAAYGDEMRPAPHPRSETVLRALASYRGAQIGVMYAEAFQPIRVEL